MEEVFIHDTAEVSKDAKVGIGTKVWNQAQIRENVFIGENCIISKNVYIDSDVVIGNRVKIQNNVNVYHGVKIEDDVFLGPSMTFTNDMYPRANNSNFVVCKTIVKRGASIGANSTIRCGIIVGEFATVGCGSVVVKNVLPHELVVGNPAKRIGFVCECGNKLDENGVCMVCGKKHDIELLKKGVLYD